MDIDCWLFGFRERFEYSIAAYQFNSIALKFLFVVYEITFTEWFLKSDTSCTD